MATLSGRECRSFSSINDMAKPSMNDLIHLMATEAEARREEAYQHRLEMATEAEAKREEANQHRLKMVEMAQQQVLELRAIDHGYLKTEGQGKRHPIKVKMWSPSLQH